MDNNNNKTYMQIFAFLILAAAIKMFIDHRKTGYQGKYNPHGSYQSVTQVKEKMSRVLFVEFFMLLVFGLPQGTLFYNSVDPLNSWIGRTLILVMGYFTYYELIEPYFVTKLPNF